MADGLFIGWGMVVRGREEKAMAVLAESIKYWSELKESGQIESFDVAMLDPHGGDLQGFALLRGTREQLFNVSQSPEFQRHLMRAQLIVDGVGVVGATMGQELMEQWGTYEADIRELVGV